jgi:hypothetical protein
MTTRSLTRSPKCSFYWIALAILAASAIVCACATRFVEVPPEASAKSERDAITLSELKALGRSGDWLVIRGYHVTDNVVASLTNKPFSHAAVLDLERDQVIEAEAQGVHTSSLADFVAKSHRLLLIRPVWEDAHSAQVALTKARSLVGRQYDFLGLIGFNIPDTYYCSELVLEVYRPFVRRNDIVPRPIEPGQLHHYGRILFDSGAL